MKHLWDQLVTRRNLCTAVSALRRSALGISALTMLAACGLQPSNAQVPPAGRNVGPRTAGAHPVTIAAGDCLDGTSSSAPSYAIRMRALVASAIADWAPRPSAYPIKAMPAQSGLHLVMRSVSTSSYTTDELVLDKMIPFVPALTAEPDPATDRNYDQDVHAWTQKKTTWGKAATAASNAAAHLADQVRQFQILRYTYSAIYSCIAAAAAQLDISGAHARLAVESDMINNRPVVGLRLSGDAVLIVGICPAAHATSCPRRFAAARTYLRRHGAASVQIVRADAVTPGTFKAFWRGS